MVNVLYNLGITKGSGYGTTHGFNNLICLSFTHTFGIRLWLFVWFITGRLAFCGRQLKYFHDPYLRFVSLFYAILSSFTLFAIAEMFYFDGALWLDNRPVESEVPSSDSGQFGLSDSNSDLQLQ